MYEDTNDRSELLTIGEAARRLGVAPRTLSGWIAAEKVRAVRLSERTTRVKSSEVQRLIDEGSK